MSQELTENNKICGINVGHLIGSGTRSGGVYYTF